MQTRARRQGCGVEMDDSIGAGSGLEKDVIRQRMMAAGESSKSIVAKVYVYIYVRSMESFQCRYNYLL